MKSLAVDVSNSAYDSLLGAGAVDQTAMSRLVEAAIVNYVREDVSWIGAPSYPFRETWNHALNSVSAFSINYNDLGVGITATRETVVILEGRFFRVSSKGVTIEMEERQEVRHAMIVTFDAENLRNDFEVSGIEELVDRCEKLRAAKNIFYALRVDGEFRSLTLRSAPCPQVPQHPAAGQHSVHPRIVENVEGTLIGIWSSRFTSNICAPGYHFYFVSRERDRSGSVIDCSASGLRMLGMPVTNLRLLGPDSPRPEPGKESMGETD